MPAQPAINRHRAVERGIAHPMRDWRCLCCFKLLGRRNGDRVHLKFTTSHEYVANLPATAICRCGTLNELRSSTSF